MCTPVGTCATTVTPQARSCSDLVGVVAEERDPRRAERVQHLRGGNVAAFVLAVAERHVRVVRVDPGFLQRIRLELRVEPDAAAFLAQVEQIAAGVRNPLDRLAQLRPAVATLAPEHVAGETLAVGTDQRHAALSGVTEREGEMLAAVDEPVEAVDLRVRCVAVGEPEGQHDLRADRRSDESQRHRPSSNRDERA